MIELFGIERRIREYLVEFVKSGDYENSFLRYAPLAEKFEIPYSNDHERNQFHEKLDRINRYEFENERPLLSVVVVNEETIPGHGFFTMARELKKMKPGDDEDVYALSERRDLFDYWQNKNV